MIEAGYGSNDRFLLLKRYLRKDGQGQHFPGGLFCLWKTPLFVTQLLKTGLQVQGDRIVYPATNAIVGKEVLELISFVGANDVLVKHVNIVVPHKGKAYGRFLTALIIPRGSQFCFLKEFVVGSCM